MDSRSFKNASSSLLNSEKDDTLGLLNMENLRAFGETSRNSSVNRDKINERLKLERAKAMETLQKSSSNGKFKQPNPPKQLSIGNKENESNITRTPVLDRTDYVPYRGLKSINITDLAVDKTIHLESSDIKSSASKNSVHKISFEPCEMTGRSTALSRELNRQRTNRHSLLSVEEILASSSAASVRSLCDSLRESYGGNTSLSLPRTADMSKTTQESLYSGATSDQGDGGFSFSNAMRADESCFGSENFAPAELMHSKLMEDEKQWAQEYAAIPEKALSDSHAKPQNRMHSETLLTSMMSNGVNDPDFSLGNYFGQQSEDLWNIVHTKSPVKGRPPTALVDATITEDNSIDVSITPKADTKAYSIHAPNRTSVDKKHESKDSGNATDSSYLLSVSAIERALVDIQTEDSDGSVVNRLLMAKKTRSCMNPYREQIDEKPSHRMLSLGEAIERVAVANNKNPETILEDKENFDPEQIKVMKYSDTMSFSDSLLNSTDMKKFDRSSLGATRSPLHPIELNNPTITVDEAADFADLDEHPSLLEKDASRKVRRHKTTRDLSPASTDSHLDTRNHQYQDRKQKRSRSATRGGDAERRERSRSKETRSTEKEKSQPMSLSSTRNEQDEMSSPNPSTKSSSSILRKNTRRSPSPVFFESPISSPRSCLSSHVSSPTWTAHSPQLDNTTNSDRRYLVGTVSSPDCGKFSLPSYGLVTKTASTGSVKGRSTSRCSNSSEFSHRDGKLIPLKVTCLQLSWGSIRLRKNANKSMQIKNTSDKRLIVKVDVSGPGFQIVNNQGNLITLQSQECRSVSLNFCPTVIGVAVGVLSFSAPNSPSSQTYLDVPLYGYGGTASLIPQNIMRGPIGAPFLTMGDLKELSGPLEKTFKIYNKGPLHGFAVIIIDSFGLDMPRLRDSIEVTPNKVLIPPEGVANIRVTLKPRRDDIKKIIKKISDVLALANMRIICGDEPSRQRIRNLIRTMKEEDKSKLTSKSLDRVWASFPGEKPIDELDALKEKSEVALDMISSLRIHEIALTLNHYRLDETADSTLVFPDADETVIFRTFCSTSPTQMLDPVDEEQEENSSSAESWSVRPNVLQFDPPMSFVVRNSSNKKKLFEISCNYDLFRFIPTEAYVDAGKEIQVQVLSQSEKPGMLPNDQINIWIYTQDEKVSIPVKVNKNYFPWNRR
ncbi:uncharacterized protein LOC129947836 [Eupeodes corollae]|uniref:uncharacterized protein LOC129947836 n=1 Tax=Eupeodes corollae TaxID=290404 RepID=UPI0024924D47|nr:uncharacterized protein LOC129947836 [Eupeodes corollae]